MPFFTYFDGVSVAFWGPWLEAKAVLGGLGMERFGSHQITAQWSMMTSPYSWAHDLTCTHRFYRSVRVSTGARFNTMLNGTSAELNVSWHLFLLPEPLPGFVGTGAWSKNLSAQSPTDWFPTTHFAFLCVNRPNTTCCRRSCLYNLDFNPVKPVLAEALIWSWTPCHHTLVGITSARFWAALGWLRTWVKERNKRAELFLTNAEE